MSGLLINLIIQIISGAVGGNVAAGAAKNIDLGTLGNTIAGAIGAVAVWVESPAGTDVVKASVRAPGGAWLPPRTLSEPDADAGDPQVAPRARAARTRLRVCLPSPGR